MYCKLEVIPSGLHVRAEPELNSFWITVLNKKDIVMSTKQETIKGVTWYYIDDYKGWVHGKYVVELISELPPRVTKGDKLFRIPFYIALTISIFFYYLCITEEDTSTAGIYFLPVILMMGIMQYSFYRMRDSYKK